MGTIIFCLILVLTGMSVWVFFKNVTGANTRPSILAWFIISITTGIALASFLCNLSVLNEANIAKGALFFANFGASVVIFLRLLYLGGYNLKLSVFDKVSSVAATWILIYWFLSDDPVGANLCTQGLMIISYCLIIERVVKTKGKSDNRLFWWCAVGMSILSLVSIQGGGILEAVNTYRSIISTSAVLGTIYYFRVKQCAQKVT